MRLIDADELINQGYEIVVDGWQYDTCNKSIDIDTIPTAYDVDKVVEELEELKAYREIGTVEGYKNAIECYTEEYTRRKSNEQYNKAIDDFLKNLYKIGEHRDFDWEDMYKLAEQLKAGGK